MGASTWSGSELGWAQELKALKVRLGQVFVRSEARQSCSAFIDGLLSGIERKTGWLLAEQAGFARPWRIQALLGRSQWDTDRLRQEITINSASEALQFMQDWPWARGCLFERARHLCEQAGRPGGKPAVAQLAFRAAIGEIHMFPDVRVRAQMASEMWT